MVDTTVTVLWCAFCREPACRTCAQRGHQVDRREAIVVGEIDRLALAYGRRLATTPPSPLWTREAEHLSAAEHALRRGADRERRCTAHA